MYSHHVSRFGKPFEQRLRDDAAEHAVAQKLEPFVVRRTEAAMRERLGEQRLAPEEVPEPLLERIDARQAAGSRRATGTTR